MGQMYRFLVSSEYWAIAGGAFRVRTYCAVYMAALPFMTIYLSILNREFPQYGLSDIAETYKHLAKSLFYGSFFYWRK